MIFDESSGEWKWLLRPFRHQLMPIYLLEGELSWRFWVFSFVLCQFSFLARAFLRAFGFYAQALCSHDHCVLIDLSQYFLSWLYLECSMDASTERKFHSNFSTSSTAITTKLHHAHFSFNYLYGLSSLFLDVQFKICHSGFEIGKDNSIRITKMNFMRMRRPPCWAVRTIVLLWLLFDWTITLDLT